MDWWREYFEHLPNPTNAPSGEEAGPGDPGTRGWDPLSPGLKLQKVVKKKTLGGRALGVDEICLEFLKALEVVGLSRLTQLCNVT